MRKKKKKDKENRGKKKEANNKEDLYQNFRLRNAVNQLF